MKIKTITSQTPTEFDKAVNAAISEGYVLKRRDVLPPCEVGMDVYPRIYYAELELEPFCENCKHEARHLADPTAPCNRCGRYKMWEAKE